MICQCCGGEFSKGVTCVKCGNIVCDLCALTEFENVREHINSGLEIKWTCCACDGIEPMGKYREELEEVIKETTIVDLLNQEIEWCKSKYNAEMSKVTPEQQEWFIKGLERARDLY